MKKPMSKKFKCPKCKEELDYVNVISSCYQKADLKGNKIIEYGSVEEIEGIEFIECPHCQEKITNLIEE